MGGEWGVATYFNVTHIVTQELNVYTRTCSYELLEVVKELLNFEDIFATPLHKY